MSSHSFRTDITLLAAIIVSSGFESVRTILVLSACVTNLAVSEMLKMSLMCVEKCNHPTMFPCGIPFLIGTVYDGTVIIDEMFAMLKV